MKSNNIKQKITDRFFEITIAENPSENLLDKIKNNISTAEISTKNKKTNKFILKPVLITVIFIILATTVFAAGPVILKLLGSDIDFFDNDNQTRYSSDKERIKKYSSEVGITKKGDGFSFTVDNIAYDGTFFSVFYTIKKDNNIYEETIEQIKRWENNSEILNNNSDKYIRWALLNNEIYFEIPGYIERPSIEEYNGENPGEFLHDTLKYPIYEGYFVSDYELKGMQRYTITEDLPDIFDIEISYQNQPYSYDGYINRPIINLTVDISESKVEKTIVTPNISAVIAQHNITIDRISISPLGNVLTFTEKIDDNKSTLELFNNYFIVDDKGNFYGKTKNDFYFLKNKGKDTSAMIEFYGDIPSDVKYLKLIPYNASGTEEITHFIGDNNLPYIFKQSEYGNIIIENYVITESDITVTYKYDGAIVTHYFTPPFLVITNEDKILSPSWQNTAGEPIYDRNTDSYTDIWTIEETGEIGENPLNWVKGFKAYQYNVEFLEEQAIIIPLK